MPSISCSDISYFIKKLYLSAWAHPERRKRKEKEVIAPICTWGKVDLDLPYLLRHLDAVNVPYGGWWCSKSLKLTNLFKEFFKPIIKYDEKRTNQAILEFATSPICLWYKDVEVHEGECLPPSLSSLSFILSLKELILLNSCLKPTYIFKLKTLASWNIKVIFDVIHNFFLTFTCRRDVWTSIGTLIDCTRSSEQWRLYSRHKHQILGRNDKNRNQK